MKIKKILKNKKSQLFSALIVIFVFIVLSYSLFLSITEKKKVEKEILAPMAIIEVYNQEQQTSNDYLNTVKEALYFSYSESIESKEIFSQNCQIADDSASINSGCNIENNADNILIEKMNLYLAKKGSDLKVSLVEGKLNYQSGENSFTSEEKATLFPFEVTYKKIEKQSYPLEFFYLTSFSKIKTAIELCKDKGELSELSSCFKTNLPEMNIRVSSSDGFLVNIEPLIELINSNMNLANSKISLKI
jgi:hypothetical protein